MLSSTWFIPALIGAVVISNIVCSVLLILNFSNPSYRKANDYHPVFAASLLAVVVTLIVLCNTTGWR